LLLLAVPFVALGTAALLTDPACAQEAEARVGVIVDDGEGDDTRSCIDPGETEGEPASPTPALNGIDALEMAGHELVTKDFGGALGMAVCKIDGVGTDDCNFDAGFWAYYHRGPDGSFQFSEVGPSSYQVPDGGIEAWVWAPAGTEAAPPDPVTLEEICVQSVTALDQTTEEEKNPALGWILAGAAVVVLGGSFLLVRVFTRGS
jgi:hypothetical protein